MSDTRQRILDTARSLFNAEGLSRVGVRDIARELEMSPGNLAYHFPTKDDLVEALVIELYELDQSTVFATMPINLTPSMLYLSAVAVMRNLLSWRFVLLSYVEDAVRASPRLQKMELELRAHRRERHEQMLSGLVLSGHVDERALARSEYIFEQSEMLSSGWLKAAVLQGMKDDEAIVLHYAKVGIALLEPWATPKGEREIGRILEGAFDRRRSGPAQSTA